MGDKVQRILPSAASAPSSSPSSSPPAFPARARSVPSSDRGVHVDDGGFVRVDGVLVGRRIIRGDRIFFQVCDKDKRRSAERGSRYYEIPIEELVSALSGRDLSELTKKGGEKKKKSD